ncbi:phosphate signaling complex protein PhoU [Schnuerera ultunensis]|uniref:Phosphate-specific transport system accessory protein PhoU n=1 Tax=[Clostridium] ultunense Esp TaxID=1288971 RepID=A0A1M4PKK8_9FIRM|nr:phosphate signaling complex protein PhoU [Schnuerera ultunensis]SHD76018.1 Phosphate-specific transport system accessory protein PhoU homolog [[Clostridium] ultunense Esp]
MIRNRFDRELDLLNDELIEMGNLIESAIKAAITALKEQNVDLARRIVDNDKEIDDMERAIEQRCLRLLLQQQPVAGDLRLISAALKMITDMERIGDQAADISEISIRLANETYLKELVHIPQMAEGAIKMVKNSIDSFVRRDIELVKEVILYDDTVDQLFDIIKNELVDLVREDRDSKEQVIDLLMIAKYLERIGDHAQNIAEWVYFAIKGEHYTW